MKSESGSGRLPNYVGMDFVTLTFANELRNYG